jgi:small subunit ribosomal protein S16
MGRRHRPFYRITAVDQRKKRDGKVIEELGHYDPLNTDDSRKVVLNSGRIQYWLGVGAQPSDTVRGLIKRAGAEEKK